MASTGGFWSYVHADDEAESGRITQLARDLVAQFALLTAEPIDLFLDRDMLQWGEPWRSALDDSLASVAFFIPVLTPRYFRSVECRRELQYFARRTATLGVRDLVMPLFYVDVPELGEDHPSDDVMALVREFHWEDWRKLRFAERTSREYRASVARLATRLVEANMRAEQTELVESAATLNFGPNIELDEPALLDRLAEVVRAIPVWNETLLEIGGEIATVDQLMQETVTETERSSEHQSIPARLAVARRLAVGLQDPSQSILDLGSRLTSELHNLDTVISALLEVAGDAGQGAQFQFPLDEHSHFLGGIRAMSETARRLSGSLDTLVNAILPIEQISRELRPPLRTLRRGLTAVLEGQEIIEGWNRLTSQAWLDASEGSGR